MFESTLTALVIAVLAAVASYFSWSSNKAVSLGCGVVCVIASLFALLFAFLGAVVLAFKLLPLVVLAVGGYLVYRAVSASTGPHQRTHH